MLIMKDKSSICKSKYHIKSKSLLQTSFELIENKNWNVNKNVESHEKQNCLKEKKYI